MSRLSVSFYLKAAIGLVVACILAILLQGALAAWKRVGMEERIAVVTEATSQMFQALHNLRVDRSYTNRYLVGDAIVPALNDAQRDARTAEVPALHKALAVLRKMEFPGQPGIVSRLENATQKLEALHAETLSAMQRPKAERRPGIAQEFVDHANMLLEFLSQTSDTLNGQIKMQDPLIDKLFEAKTTAWLVRNSAGDASLLLSNAAAGIAPPADAEMKYAANMAKAEAGWELLTKLFSGVETPPRLVQAMERGTREYFTPDVVGRQGRYLKTLLTGGTIDMTSPQWTAFIVPRLGALLGVAEAALEVAQQRTQEEISRAQSEFWIQVALLCAAAVIGGVLILLISLRVTRPLIIIKESMMTLAQGNLDVTAPYTDRHDEIGALGKTMEIFRNNMAEAERLRGQQAEQERRTAEQRRADLNALADGFNLAVGGIVEQVASTATELQSAAQLLTGAAEQTSKQSASVAAASTEASSNVGSVASATEQLSASVVEISRQVGQSATIAAKAVDEANHTNEQVKGLASAADKIGSIVELINQIAGKTNLLALNATIEAARAGEAGKGFAVVAAEVKQLADQTGKATAEISAQIGAMQNASTDAANAIHGIGATIETMNDIAAQISDAVDSQEAATNEIARSVREASRGTALVSSNISGVSQAASESSSAAARVLSSASELSRHSTVLRSEVAKFLSTVRAA
jgi:methyl-accepting chemotaxis protein